MTGAELGFGILAGVIVLIFAVTVVTEVVTKASSKEISDMRNVYLGKLENSDSSIQNAMEYLKLTNGIKQKLNREKK
ncbi:MAG: hypothetical protein NC543_14490 [bacterium]|nr:hypothetical protein [bacterium]MCM1376550.1 hypothetical protein [Muribaculum sp.]